jgi:hypothetical protein
MTRIFSSSRPSRSRRSHNSAKGALVLCTECGELRTVKRKELGRLYLRECDHVRGLALTNKKEEQPAVKHIPESIEENPPLTKALVLDLFLEEEEQPAPPPVVEGFGKVSTSTEDSGDTNSD